MNFLAQALQDAALPPLKNIAPAFEIPFLPLWAVIVLTVLGTLLLAWLGWWIVIRRKIKSAPPLPPRSQALNALNLLRPNIETDEPSDFTVEVASILRRFVVGQFGIPATKQTSQEFLQSLAGSAHFKVDQTLLKSFLDKCDLIEFAKLEATSEDNRELWEKAEKFVVGGGNQ